MCSVRQIVFTIATLVVFITPVYAQPPWIWKPPVRGPQLGVLVDNLSFNRLDSLKLPYGVLITQVMPGSPAEAGGLRAGDILLTIDDQPVFSVARLRWLIGKSAPDAHLALKLHRNGETPTATIVLREGMGPSATPPGLHREWYWTSPGYLGVSLQSLTTGLREALAIPKDAGLLVAEVYKDSPADKAGLRAGDVILKMDRRTIMDVDDMQRVLDYFEPGEQLQVVIIREKKQEQFTVTLGERMAPRFFGRSREWMKPYNNGPPFFTDPDWWRGMEEFIERWRHYWEDKWRERSHQTL